MVGGVGMVPDDWWSWRGWGWVHEVMTGTLFLVSAGHVDRVPDWPAWPLRWVRQRVQGSGPGPVSLGPYFV